MIPEFVFRKVLIKGRYDHTHTMILSPRVREGVHGVHVITPLIRDNGSTILVDRGFVSNDHLSSINSEEENGEVEVLGMLRNSQPRNLFTPDNNPEKGDWYWTDVENMAEHVGGKAANVQPVFVEQIFGKVIKTLSEFQFLIVRLEGHAGDANIKLSRGIPVGRTPTVDLRNSHLSYVITWCVVCLHVETKD